jgi:hypothetical protein
MGWWVVAALAGSMPTSVPLDVLRESAEFYVRAHRVSHRRALWFEVSPWATTYEVCIAELVIDETYLGTIETGRVELWAPCELTNLTAIPEDQPIWLVANRFYGGWFLARPEPGDTYHAYPAASNAIVLSHHWLLWSVNDAGLAYGGGDVTFAVMPSEEASEHLPDPERLFFHYQYPGDPIAKMHQHILDTIAGLPGATVRGIEP